MKALVLILLAALINAADPGGTPPPRSAAQDAIALLGKLPDPQVLPELDAFFARASSADAGHVLMHIAIAVVRPARPSVIPLLSHRDPLVVDRALRALAAIGYQSSAVREQIERQLAREQSYVAIQAALCLAAGADLRAVPALTARLPKGPSAVSVAVVAALQRLTHVDFKNDAKAWDDWYQEYRAQAAERLATQVERLGDPDPKQQIAAIRVLGAMQGHRLEVLELIAPLVGAEDPTVAITARQVLATLAPTEYTMPTAAEVVASRPAPPVPVAKPVVIDLNKGWFDTWYGLFLTTCAAALVLTGMMFLLRSGPAKPVKKKAGMGARPPGPAVPAAKVVASGKKSPQPRSHAGSKA